MTSKRMGFGGKEGPGPGEYEQYTQDSVALEHANLPESENRRYESKLPRYHELVVAQEAKKVGEINVNSTGHNRLISLFLSNLKSFLFSQYNLNFSNFFLK